MKIEGLNQNTEPALRGMGSSEEAAIQKQIQSLRKELGELEKKGELSQEEAKKKNDLMQRIAELEQRLQQIKGGKQAAKTDKKEEGQSITEQTKEEGKGDTIDERI